MSVFGFDIRDYTDPNRILEQSLAPQPPVALQSSGNGYAPPAPQQAPPVSQQAPVTVDNTTGQQVTAPPGINPAATQQPPAVPIPGTAGPSGSVVSTPASISKMEGVTNQDRLHAMAMVLGAVGQNNFSNVLNAAQTGLMEKDIIAKAHNEKLSRLTMPSLEYDANTGVYDYTPPKWELDKNGNYQARPLADIKKDYDDFYGESPARRNRETIELSDGVNYYKDSLGSPGGPEPVDQAQLDRVKREKGRGGLTAKDAAAKLGEEGKMLKEMLPNYMTLDKTLANENNPFADVATLFAFMKTADPGSVVRPSEGEMFSSAGSLSTELANALNGVISGKSLTKEQQGQLRVVVDDIMIGHVERTEQARSNWEDFFTQDAQAADGWDVNILNPYDALYGSDIPTQIRERMANRGKPQPGIDDEDQAAIDAAVAEQEAEQEAIRRGTNLGTYTGNPRILR